MACDQQDSDYESDSNSDEDDEDDNLEPVIRAGGRVRHRIESDDDDEDEGGGGAKRRCQEGAVEARGSLGGGGKRGWLA